MIILLKILLAHLIGDFMLQPNKWVKAKEEKKLGAWQLYIHVVIHALLIMLFVWELDFWKWAAIISLVHLVIDAGKISLSNKNNWRSLFFLDQLFHIASIYFIWLWYEGNQVPFYIFKNEKFLALLTAIILLSTPVSFAVKTVISKWTPDNSDSEGESLQSAGKFIGIIERLLIFIFIIIGQWTGIGFLLAAKSIFRFGDLKESNDRKLTEYILIGTLLSFGIAIIVGLTYLYLIDFF